MASGDVTVFGPTTPDKLKSLIEAAGVGATWGLAMCSYGVGMVVSIAIEP